MATPAHPTRRPADPVRRPEPGQPTIVYFHGNATDLASSTERLGQLQAYGFGIAGLEYVGYGPSLPDRPTQHAVIAGCVDAMHTISAEPAVGPVILLGYSLGAALATQMARRGWGDRMVLAAPFTSAAALARTLVPQLPARLFLDPRPLDSAAAAPRIDMPVIVTHGENDTTIPASMGRTLAARFPHGRFLPVPDADHTTLAEHLHDAIRAVLARDQ